MLEISVKTTIKELTSKILEASKSLLKNEGLFADPGAVVGELNRLKIGCSSDVWSLILKLLKEISPTDYTGCKPPLKSYLKRIQGRDLLAFSWFSETLNKKMYLKFALKNDRFYYVSLHEEKP
jgi:hypothetical protein